MDDELICPICSAVMEEPLQAPACEHAFCAACINAWLTRNTTCPVDRQSITSDQLKPVPRILRNLLSRLQISCENVEYGCTAIVKLDVLATHLEECEHNPKKPIPCEQGCGLVIPKDEVKDHNCVRELRALVQSQQHKMGEFSQDLGEYKYQLDQYKMELQLLKDLMRAMRISNPAMRAIAEQMEHSEVVRWTESLTKSRVTRWGGMISTPDNVLQAVMRRALTECGCPPHILNDLMENAHERRWPPGLSTLETRQVNRRQYDNYICRRIPGKQAVLVMSCDNQHMDNDMLLDPGLVMIFAHGCENDNRIQISS